MWETIPVRKDCDYNRVRQLCGILRDGRGKELSVAVLKDIENKSLRYTTYVQLSRWVNPDRAEARATPIAEAISYELFGVRISRVKAPGK